MNKYLSAVAVMLATQGASAQDSSALADTYFYFGGHASQYFVDTGDAVDGDTPDDTTLPGLQAGYRVSPTLSVQVWWERNNYTSKQDLYEGDMATLVLSGRYHWHENSWHGLEPYAGFNVGQVTIDNAINEDDTSLGVELGVQKQMRPHWFIDAGARPLYSTDNERWDTEVYLALNYRFGEGAAMDSSASTSDNATPPPAEPEAAVTTAVVFGDGDNDGVTDALDQCPATAPDTGVDASGCPSDLDNDGVGDSLDHCPDTPAGAKVNEHGCKLVLHTPIRQTVHINFASGTANIDNASMAEVEKIAEMMRAYPDAPVTLEGHTDSAGAAESNLRLSTLRAEAVRDELVTRFGMDNARISAVGKGETQPIADNNTVEGRKENRRVEVILGN